MEKLQEMLRDERGVTEVLDEALLVALGIALFIGVIVSPISGIFDFIWNLPDITEQGFQAFVDQLSKLTQASGLFPHILSPLSPY